MGSYLRDRQNYISYNGYRSPAFVNGSGVPQGSNLGPLLFILFIDDLLKSLRCRCLAYADDLKIYTSVAGPQDAATLQCDLNTLVDWCEHNGLFLNVDKCCYVTYSRRREIVDASYVLGDAVLSRRRTVRDLGVVFDERLTFNEHI